ncbi:MAG: DNA recombination protein RmuC [Candidatus Kapaibacterium sp.]
MLDTILIAAVAAIAIAQIAMLLAIRSQTSQLASGEFADRMKSFESAIQRLESQLRDEFARNREELSKNSRDTREELSKSLGESLERFGRQMSASIHDVTELQKTHLETFSKQLDSLSKNINVTLSALTESTGQRMEKMRGQIAADAKTQREESAGSLKSFEEQLARSIREFNELQKQKFDTLENRQNELLRSTDQRLEKMRETMEQQIKSMQQDNSAKLEKMRETVDEKLHKTLEQRLGESFKQVSERLELVHKGLGEMQNLASGVGDLKRVLSNVKNRGVLGEYQLENILESVLAPDQFGKNVKPDPNSNCIVEFALRLPGRNGSDEPVLLPIDSKFPTEDYQNLLDAYDKADKDEIEKYKKMLAGRIKLSAKDISDKYIDPPNTTDFAIMFLPFEGLYAEVIRDPGLFELIQREYKVIITGPTTLSAILNSLQMGFRTLAIEKRSSEVWDILAAVKKEFDKFGDVLQKTQKQLNTATNSLDTLVGTRTRQIQNKLRKVQSLPESDFDQLIGDGSDDDEEELFI